MAIQNWMQTNQTMPDPKQPAYKLSSFMQGNNQTPQQSPIATAMNQQPQSNYRDLPYQEQLSMFQSDPNLGKSELSRAMNQANLYKATGDTGAYDRANTWIGQINTATGGKLAESPANNMNSQLEQLRSRAGSVNPQMTAIQQALQQRINTPVQQFSYDQNSDPQYQNALKTAQQNAQTASNNAMVGLGNRGIANSSIAVDRANQIQQRELGNVTANVLPNLIEQAFQRYQAQQQQDNQQTGQMFNLANLYNSQDQQQFGNIAQVLGLQNNIDQQGITNQRNALQDVLQNKQFNFNAANTVGQQLGRVLQPKDDISNLYNQDNAPLNLQGQAQDFNQNLATRDQNLQETQVNAQLTGRLPDGSPTYASGQDVIRNTAQYAGLYNGQPTMQKIMQDQTINNMNADNLRAAAAEARAAGRDDIAIKMDIWGKSGIAPAGIPGVPQGTQLAGQNKPLPDDDVAKMIESSPLFQKQYDDNGKLLNSTLPKENKDQLALYIKSLGLPPDQAKKWFVRYGLWSGN